MCMCEFSVYMCLCSYFHFHGNRQTHPHSFSLSLPLYKHEQEEGRETYSQSYLRRVIYMVFSNLPDPSHMQSAGVWAEGEPTATL